MASAITQDELAAIREYHNKRNRDWWHRMTKEERREKRNQYALNAIKRRQRIAESPGMYRIKGNN